MKKQLLFLFCMILMSYYSWASHDNTSIGGASAAMGNASVTFCDFWSVHNNQAGLGFYNKMAAGIYYENRFLTKELSSKSGAFIMPTKSGVFGITMDYFGYQNYNEKKIGLAYGKTFGNKFSAGISLDYLQTHVGENYGNKNNFTFEAGLIYKMNKNLTLASHVFNPLSTKLTDYNNERIPAIFKFGMSWKFSEKVIAVAEAEKDLHNKTILKAGVEYHIIEQLYLRIGMSTNPIMNTFGFGLEFGQLKFDFSSSLHQTLGYSPQVSIIFNFDEKKLLHQ